MFCLKKYVTKILFTIFSSSFKSKVFFLNKYLKEVYFYNALNKINFLNKTVLTYFTSNMLTLLFININISHQ